MFNHTQIQILGTIREYDFAVAKGAYELANRIREANPDLVDEFNKVDFETFKKSEPHHDPRKKFRYDDAVENAEQYGGPDR